MTTPRRDPPRDPQPAGTEHASERHPAGDPAAVLPCETALPLPAEQPAPAEPREVQDDEMVTVRVAAGHARVPPSHVHMWIARGKLTAQPGDARGRLVSVSAVLAVAAARAASRLRGAADPVPGMAEYVPPAVAARAIGVPGSTISYWGKRGKVATRPGPFGQLVRLADVLTVAAQLTTRRATDDTGTE